MRWRVGESSDSGIGHHYFAKELTDNGPRFQEMVEYGDGKIVTYIDAITDAFLDEVMEYCPDALILSGDLTLEGEKKSHQELAKKLEKVEDAGNSGSRNSGKP